MRLGQRPGSSLAVAASLALTLSACGNNTENNSPQPTPVDMSRRDMGGDMMALVDMPVDTDQGNPSDLGSDMGTDMPAEDMTQLDMETDMSASLDCVDVSVKHCDIIPRSKVGIEQAIQDHKTPDHRYFGKCAEEFRKLEGNCITDVNLARCPIDIEETSTCLFDQVCVPHLAEIKQTITNSPSSDNYCLPSAGMFVQPQDALRVTLVSTGKTVLLSDLQQPEVFDAGGNGLIRVNEILPRVKRGNTSDQLVINSDDTPFKDYECDKAGQNQECKITVEFNDPNLVSNQNKDLYISFSATECDAPPFVTSPSGTRILLERPYISDPFASYGGVLLAEHGQYTVNYQTRCDTPVTASLFSRQATAYRYARFLQDNNFLSSIGKSTSIQ